MTSGADPNWCDFCEEVHTDIKKVHCSVREHCTHTRHKCAGKAEFNGHGSECCICGNTLTIAYQANVNMEAMPVAQVKRITRYSAVENAYFDNGTCPRSDEN